MNKILFIITGGTIDSKTKGQERDVLLEHSEVPKYIASLKQDAEFVEVFMKDSRDITDVDRQTIADKIESSAYNKIIVTHGTFTLVDTAKFLQKNLKGKNRAIILTGAMTPLIFNNSDAPENLKYAISQLNSLMPGIYICMNGRTFLPEEAVKDEINEKFYSTND